MLKSVQKSNISQRDFKVHKNWTLDYTVQPVISASADSGLFDTGSSTSQSGLFIGPLYSSLKAKYFNHSGNIVETFSSYKDLSTIKTERPLPSTMYVIPIDQSKFGDSVKKGSIALTDNVGGVTYRDNKKGSIAADVPLYSFTDIDFQNETITIVDNDNEIFIGTISQIDYNSGLTTLTFGNDTDIVTIVQIDFQTGQIQFANALDFDGLEIDEILYGNVFYEEGLVVMRTPIENYNLRYKSSKTIYETEILITAKAGEFNYSQNPSAVEVVVSGSFDFAETAIPNVRPAGTRKIKHYTDIKRKTSYEGTVGSTTGSWDDYDNNALSDPTGSYITTYISTIGLYDNDGDMVAVAKLPKPIKNLPDYDMNFIVRFDT
jgi:hypothetical protein